MVDPEIPVLTIADLGVLRDVAVSRWPRRGRDHADLFRLPRDEHDRARDRAGAGARRDSRDPKVRTVLSPAWTTDWMSDDGRRKLREYGIAPPQAAAPAARCSASSRWRARNAAPADTELLSEFGSTSCKALWRCKSCREPFDYFKCH